MYPNLPYRSTEQDRILRDDSQMATKRIQANRCNIQAVEQNGARCDVNQSVQSEH